MEMRFLTLLLLAVSLFWSCQIQPDEITKTRIDQTLKDAPVLYFFENQETLYLRGTQSIYYYPEDGQEIFLAEVYLDDELIHTDSENYGNFHFDSKLVSDGEYELKVHLYTASETGSLADKLGSEPVLHVYTRNAIVDNAPLAMNLDGVNFFIEDSVLHMQCPKFEGYGFSNYQVKILYTSHGSGGTFEIFDIEQTSMSFEEFAGSSIGIEFRLFAKNSSIFKNVQYAYFYQPTAEIDENNKLTVTVNESPFRAFDKFEVDHTHTNGQPNDTHDLVRVGPNTFEAQMRTFFPTLKTFTIYYRSKADERKSLVNLTNLGVWSGLGKTRFLDDRFITTNGTKIEVRDLQNTLLGSWSGDKANISNDGLVGYTITGTQISKIDPLTLEKTDICNTMDISRIANYGTTLVIMPTSGETMGLVKYFGSGSNIVYGTLYIINVNNCELIKEFSYNWNNYGSYNPVIDYRNAYLHETNNLIIYKDEYWDPSVAEYLNTNPEIYSVPEYHPLDGNSYFNLRNDFYLKVDGNVIRKIQYSLNGESEVEIGTITVEWPILNFVTDNEHKYGTVHQDNSGNYFINIYDLDTNELLATFDLNPGYNLSLLKIYGKFITQSLLNINHKAFP